jgi:WD40 repeat protein
MCSTGQAARWSSESMGLPEVVLHLAFSPDGRLLAAALGGANGVRLYETHGFAEVARDDEYDDSSYWLDFAADGRIATTSDDGFIRLYDSRLELVTKTEAPSGRRPFGIAFSPDGHEIAVGYDDTTAVDIVSAGDLRLLHSLDMSGVTNGNLLSAAWSADGERLCAGGRYGDETGVVALRCWGERGRGPFEDVTFGATNTILDLHPLAMGGFAIGTSDPLIAVLDERDPTRWVQRGEIADFRGQTGPNAMGVSESGDVIAFGFQQWGSGRPVSPCATVRSRWTRCRMKRCAVPGPRPRG